MKAKIVPRCAMCHEEIKPGQRSLENPILHKKCFETDRRCMEAERAMYGPEQKVPACWKCGKVRKFGLRFVIGWEDVARPEKCRKRIWCWDCFFAHLIEKGVIKNADSNQ